MSKKQPSLRLGVDVGGTKIEAALLARNGETVWRQRQHTPQADYAGLLSVITTLVHEAERVSLDASVPVGLAVPGALSIKTNRIKNSNSTCLNGRAFKRDLEQRLERSVVMANDADCFALSEACDGAAAGLRTVFGVIIGTGTGGGFVVNGRLLEGPNQITGEWGHTPMPYTNDDDRCQRPCYCGAFGCVETYLSGVGFCHTHDQLTAQHNGINMALTSDLNKLSVIERVAQASAGDITAQRALHAYCEHLAQALATVINILDPYAIVLGGGLSNVTDLYAEVPKRWGKYIFSDSCDTLLLQARHGDSSGVRGAAWLC